MTNDNSENQDFTPEEINNFGKQLEQRENDSDGWESEYGGWESYSERGEGNGREGCAGIFIFFIFTGSGLGYIVHLLT